jgi:hypothetical protein
VAFFKEGPMKFAESSESQQENPGLPPGCLLRALPPMAKRTAVSPTGSEKRPRLHLTSLRDSFNIGLCGVAGARQHGHALAGHFPGHFTQFVWSFVVDGGELFEGGGGA